MPMRTRNTFSMRAGQYYLIDARDGTALKACTLREDKHYYALIITGRDYPHAFG